MLIAGEASGDALAAELVQALREELTSREIQYTADLQPLRTGLEPRFFGAGGPRMAAAGVELAFDLTQHSIIGIPSLKQFLQLRRRFQQLFQLAIDRQPDVILGVDFNHFNLRFAHAIRQYLGPRQDWFHAWRPKLVKFISPQVWASRESRAFQLERDFDLLLSIIPFEPEWYARRTPRLRVEFVGHPMVDRFPKRERSAQASASPLILLLPGSREGEVQRHLPVVLGAWELIKQKLPAARAKMIVPHDTLATRIETTERKTRLPLEIRPGVEVQVGYLPDALATADLAITKTGTVATECALAGVPAVTFYKASWLTYQFGKRVVTVKWLTLPNILANEELFPEFVQHAATPENIARAALDLLQNEPRRARIKTRLAEIVRALGEPGATGRAAKGIAEVLTTKGHE